MKITKMNLEFVLSVIIMYWYIIKQDLKKKIEKSHFKLGGVTGSKSGLRRQRRTGAEIYIKDCKNLAVWFGCEIWGVCLQISRPPDNFEG